MSDVRSILERGVAGATPPPNGFERMLGRRDRRNRNRRIRAGVLALVIALVLVAVGASMIRSASTPATSPTPTPSTTGDFAQIRGWIAYQSDSKSDLWAIDPANPSQQISLGPVDGGDPIGWSPDGTHLLLLVDKAGGNERQLYVMNSDGSQTQLADGFIWGASFSPDGATVAYGQGFDLNMIGVDGGTPQQIASGNRTIASPAWSPDGSQIAFITAGEIGRNASLSVINADGTGRRALVELSDFGYWGLDWSPDGSLIAFVMHSAVYVIQPDGTGLREVASGAVPSSLSWSPDGSRIAFVCGTEQELHWNLCTTTVDGSDVQTYGMVEFLNDGNLHTAAWNSVG